MKNNIIITILLSVVVSSAAQTTDTVIKFGDRLPYLYYWDTNWIDHYQELHPNVIYYPYHLFHVPPMHCVSARPCIAPTPLKVIGIAAPADIKVSSGPIPTYDTSMAGRLAEYFRLYVSDGYTASLVAMTRWDTATPNKSLQIRHGDRFDTLPLYEAYFNNPVIVEGLFFVGGTSFNNYDLEFPDPNNPTCTWAGHYEKAHPETYYYGAGTVDTDLYIYPGYLFSQIIIPDDDRLIVNNPDTSVYVDYLCDGNPGTNFFFAIFDTSYVFIPKDSLDNDIPCLPPTGFRLDAIDTATATLAWNHQDSTSWLLQIFPADSIPDSACADTVDVNMTILAGLDTAVTYAARLRTLCVHDSASAWTDTIQFRLLQPPADTTHHTEPDVDTLSITTPVDFYTHLFPNPSADNITIVSSFHLKKVEIFSANGRQLLAEAAHGITTTVDISSLPPAAYIVRITTPSGVTTKRLVKK